MRIDNVYSENRIQYPWENFPPPFSDEENAHDKVPHFPEEKDSLPAVYKRHDARRKDYIIDLSSDLQVSDGEPVVMQGIFELDADHVNEMEYRFSSWANTVSTILGRGVQKGIYINLVV